MRNTIKNYVFFFYEIHTTEYISTTFIYAACFCLPAFKAERRNETILFTVLQTGLQSYARLNQESHERHAPFRH